MKHSALSRVGKWLCPFCLNDLCSKPKSASLLWLLTEGAAKYGPTTVHPSSPAGVWSAGGPGTDSDSGKHAAGNEFSQSSAIHGADQRVNLEPSVKHFN